MYIDVTIILLHSECIFIYLRYEFTIAFMVNHCLEQLGLETCLVTIRK